MTSTVGGFDDWMRGALEDEAAKAGESVDAYVARAVAARLILDRTGRAGHGLEELLEHVARLGLDIRPLVADDSPQAVLNDPARLRVLYDTGLLDGTPEAAYDRIVQMAADALAVPTAAVSLVDRDRQFLANAVGLTGELAVTRQTSIEDSVCQYAVMAGEPLIVEDARVHPILKDHPTVTGGFLNAYAGMPLTNSDGLTIGTLCVWDVNPRQWSTGHIEILRDLANLVRERVFGLQVT
jgi:hypothetical protein